MKHRGTYAILTFPVILKYLYADAHLKVEFVWSRRVHLTRLGNRHVE